MPENINKDFCPPCLSYTAKKLYTMPIKGRKPDSGRTHIKLAYELYRYYGGTGEHCREFIEIYSNWRMRNKTSAKYFYGHDDQSLELHCQTLQNSYNTRIKNKTKKASDSCVKTVRSLGAPSDMCTLCPLSPEYMNARFRDEQQVLGYALYNRNITFLNAVKLQSYESYSSIVYEDIALHFTGSFLKKAKDTNIFIGGSYNFHALLAYFILRHSDEFKENSSSIMENIFSRIQKGPQAVGEILLHELYKIMNAELTPGSHTAKRFPEKNYAIKDMSEDDFKASFMPAIMGLLKKAAEVTKKDYDDSIENLRNVYTYTDYPAINKNTGRGANYNEKRMTSRKKKTPADIHISMNTSSSMAKTLSDLLLNPLALSGSPLINEYESSLGIPSLPNETSCENKKTADDELLQALPQPVVNENIASSVNMECDGEPYDNILNLANENNPDIQTEPRESANITLPETNNKDCVFEETIPFLKSGILSLEETTNGKTAITNNNDHSESYNDDVTTSILPVTTNEPDGSVTLTDNSICAAELDLVDNAPDDYYADMAAAVMEDEQFKDDYAACEDTDVFEAVPDFAFSDMTSQDVQQPGNKDDELTSCEAEEDFVEKSIVMSLPELVGTSIDEQNFFSRINTLYGLNDEDVSRQARLWIEKLCVDENPVMVEYVHQQELERYGLLLYSPVDKQYYYISDDMGKDFNDVCWHVFIGENPKITLNFAGVSSFLSNRSLRARNLVSLPPLFAAIHPDCERFLLADILMHEIKSRQNCNIYELIMPLYADALDEYYKTLHERSDNVQFNKLLNHYKNFEKIACYSYYLDDVTTISGPGVFIDVPGRLDFAYTGEECLKKDSGYSVVFIKVDHSDFKYDFTPVEFFIEMLTSMLHKSCFSKYDIRLAGYTEQQLSIICPTNNLFMTSDIISDTAGRTFKKLCKNINVVPEFEIGCTTK